MLHGVHTCLVPTTDLTAICHCERSEAISRPCQYEIASSLRSSQWRDLYRQYTSKVGDGGSTSFRQCVKLPPMTKRDIAAVLEEIAFLLELKGENPFKVKAYATGARVIESLPEEPAVLGEKGLLRNVKGIGQNLEGTVTELVTTGRSTLHQELQGALPASLLEMAGVSGLGPEKLKAIYDHLGISTIGELEYACIENRLVGLQGFGQKTQEKILAGIRQYKRRQGFHLYANIIEEAESILAAVRGASGVAQADHVGEIRRRCEVVQSLSFVAAGPSPKAVMDALQSVLDVTQIKDQ